MSIGKKSVPFDDAGISDISDWMVDVSDIKQTIVYPYACPVEGNSALMDGAKMISVGSSRNKQDDFSVAVGGERLRCNRFRSGNKEIISARCNPQVIPSMEDLGWPKKIMEIINDNRLLKNGMVIVSGPHGGGKSTSCAAIVKRRLELAGGVARTIEDPIEYPLAGKLGKGYCYQTELPGEGDREEEMGSEIRKAMRGYPSGTPGVLMFGEIRDPVSATEAIRASLAGRLMISTVHANSLRDVPYRLMSQSSGKMSKEEFYDILESSLKLIIHQEIKNGKVNVKAVVRTGSLRAILHSKKLDGFQDEIMRQEHHFSRGTDFDFEYR